MIALSAIVAIGGWVASEALWTIHVDLTSIHARRDVSQWLIDSDGVTKPAWERARREAFAALELAPTSPALHELLGSLYFIHSRSLSKDDEAQRRQMLEEALRYQQKSLAILPENGEGWAESAVLRHMLEQSSQLIVGDWKKALAYGAYEGDVQQRLMLVALLIWPEASPEMKSWVRKRYQSASGAEREALDDMLESFEVQLDAG